MEFCRVHKDNYILIYFIVSFYYSETSGEHIEMRVEKDVDSDVYAEFTLPAYHCHHAYGFTEAELDKIEHFLRNNAVSIWDMAREGNHAESIA